MFDIYNRDQVIPFALEFKYFTSRSALECAMKSAMGHGFRGMRRRETRYQHDDDCQIPLTYKKEKDDGTFTNDSPLVKQEATEMRDFSRMFGRGV